MSLLHIGGGVGSGMMSTDTEDATDFLYGTPTKRVERRRTMKKSRRLLT